MPIGEAPGSSRTNNKMPHDNTTPLSMFSLQAGLTQGLSIGDELTVYSDKSKQESVGVVQVTGFDKDTGFAQLGPSPDTSPFCLPCHPAPSPAVLSNPKACLRLFIDPNEENLILRVLRMSLRRQIMIVAHTNAADIGLSIDGSNRLCFSILDKELLDRNLQLHTM